MKIERKRQKEQLTSAKKERRIQERELAAARKKASIAKAKLEQARAEQEAARVEGEAIAAREEAKRVLEELKEVKNEVQQMTASNKKKQEKLAQMGDVQKVEKDDTFPFLQGQEFSLKVPADQTMVSELTGQIDDYTLDLTEIVGENENREVGGCGAAPLGDMVDGFMCWFRGKDDGGDDERR